MRTCRLDVMHSRLIANVWQWPVRLVLGLYQPVQQPEQFLVATFSAYS